MKDEAQANPEAALPGTSAAQAEGGAAPQAAAAAAAEPQSPETGNEDAGFYEDDEPQEADEAAAEEEVGEGPDPAPKNVVERLYDKLPFSYRQVDIFVKIMLGVLIVLLAAAILFGRTAA